MGGFLARYYHFHETSESCSRVNTPKTTPRCKMIVDPRSPSSEISRTPIQVEATPRHRDVVKKMSPLALAAVPGEDLSGGDETRTSTSSIKHHRVSALQQERDRDPRSPSYGIARTPLQVQGAMSESEQHVEQVQEILLYEGRTEVPLVKNSPGEVTNPSCARIMGLPPQMNSTSRTAGNHQMGTHAAEAGQQQEQLDADMSTFLSGLSKALSLTDRQQQKVMRTYHGRENSLHNKKMQLLKQKANADDTPPARVRVPLSNVNSPHQMWRGRTDKEDRHHLSAYSENTPPSALHDASKLHAVWDQDATVII